MTSPRIGRQIPLIELVTVIFFAGMTYMSHRSLTDAVKELTQSQTQLTAVVSGLTARVAVVEALMQERESGHE